VNRLNRAVQTQGVTKLMQCHVGAIGQQAAKLTTVRVYNPWLTPGIAMKGRNLSCAPTLLKQLLYHPF